MTEAKGSAPTKTMSCGIEYVDVPKGSKYKYELRSNYTYDLGDCINNEKGLIVDKKDCKKIYARLKGKRLTLHVGYQWNGANYYPDYKWVLRASLVHDALCQMIREGKIKIDPAYRKCIDEQWYCIVKKDKNSRRAAMTYAAIRGHQSVPFLGGLIGGLVGAIKGKFNIRC